VFSDKILNADHKLWRNCGQVNRSWYVSRYLAQIMDNLKGLVMQSKLPFTTS